MNKEIEELVKLKRHLVEVELQMMIMERMLRNAHVVTGNEEMPQTGNMKQVAWQLAKGEPEPTQMLRTLAYMLEKDNEQPRDGSMKRGLFKDNLERYVILIETEPKSF